ncbi:hypothetical protein B0T24DRAFT_599096 [Lasiosphaeria ovina]|uniref:Uncharacterized protein n=1 Tax=Lasiosphaeria ovina TaxID=92902 RepID=A0AAE0MY47_9PEZI|nr:hypothetical protein B0T24DRAFT_599096 [Lasiosphaeria ovina]
MFLPALKAYRGYLLPLNLALSYLWLTSVIFSSQDYSGHRCYYNSPPLVNRCGLKHTVQAFNIIGFITEGLMWARHRGSWPLGGGVEKDRPLTSAAERAGLPIGANGDGQRHAVV